MIRLSGLWQPHPMFVSDVMESASRLEKTLSRTGHSKGFVDVAWCEEWFANFPLALKKKLSAAIRVVLEPLRLYIEKRKGAAGGVSLFFKVTTRKKLQMTLSIHPSFVDGVGLFQHELSHVNQQLGSFLLEFYGGEGDQWLRPPVRVGLPSKSMVDLRSLVDYRKDVSNYYSSPVEFFPQILSILASVEDLPKSFLYSVIQGKASKWSILLHGIDGLVFYRKASPFLRSLESKNPFLWKKALKILSTEIEKIR